MKPDTGVPLAFWCRVPSRPNFGDALTPWLIQRLSGRAPRFVPHDHLSSKYIVTGSIAAFAGRQCTVWGAGLMFRDDPICAEADWLAVRGPLTHARARACGAACPPVWGDPGLLLPRLHVPPTKPRRGVGFVPHFSDRPRIPQGWAEARALHLIDIQQGIETVIDEIATCEWVMSSSLHGLIVAHAYGVPAVWVRLRDLPSGDGVKFADHYASVGVDVPAPQPLSIHDTLDRRALERAAWAPARLDTEALWLCCPFRDDA